MSSTVYFRDVEWRGNDSLLVNLGRYLPEGEWPALRAVYSPEKVERAMQLDSWDFTRLDEQELLTLRDMVRRFIADLEADGAIYQPDGPTRKYHITALGYLAEVIERQLNHMQ
jgi:hypothetical protein